MHHADIPQGTCREAKGKEFWESTKTLFIYTFLQL